MRSGNLRGFAVGLTCAILLSTLRASAQAPDPNPNGWIQLSGWNLLFPLTNPYGCSGGGADNMLRNWTAPHSLLRPFDVLQELPGIDFQGAAASSGFEAGHFFAALGFSGEPIWVTTEAMARKLDVSIWPDGDVVDFQQLTDFINDLIIGEVLRGRRLPRILSDGVLGVAQTYVRNTTGTPICVDVCTASDDSVQVGVNTHLVANVSACRGLAQDCAERNPAVLEPGVNLITVLVWEGVGGWGFRLALHEPAEDDQRLSNVNQDIIRFLGAQRDAFPLASEGLAVERSTANPDCCPGSNPTLVTLRGNGRGSGTVSVEEYYDAATVPAAAFSNLSHGGTLSTVAGGPFPSSRRVFWNVSAAILNSTGVSYRVNLPGGALAQPQGFIGGCSRVTGARTVKGSWPHTGPIGAFDDSHDIGSAADLASGAGRLTVAAGADGIPGTADDVYTIVGSGNDVWDGGDSFHFAYKRVRGDFAASVRIASRTFPASGGRWGRYGLMARRDCAPDSKYSLVHANLEAPPSPPDHLRGDAVFWQFRRNHRVNGSNNNAQSMVFPDIDAGGPLLVNQPNYFRLERRGATFYGYASFDGRDWKLIGSDTWEGLPADEEVLAGFMYSKHSTASAPGTITFSDFRLGPLPRTEIFDNDLNRPTQVLYRENFDTTPNGSLPALIQGNCASGCAGFTPRVINGRLRLTQEGVNSSATSAFIAVPIPAGTGRTTVEYTVYFTHSGVTGQPVGGDPGPNPADGLTLAVLAGTNRQVVGSGGGGLGYDGITRRFDLGRPSFAVEADIWSADFHNEGSGAPNNDGTWHLGINSAASVHSIAINSSSLPDIFAPAGVRHRVTVTSEGKVTVSLGAGGGGGGGAEPMLEGRVDPLSSEGDEEMTVGFTAGTGAATSTAEIDDVVISHTPCSDIQERAVIDGPVTLRVGETALYDGRGSHSGAGDQLEPLFYRWEISGPAEPMGDLTSPTLRLIGVGDGKAILRLHVDDGRCSNPHTAERSLTISAAAGNWISYDSNNDGRFDISDAVHHLAFLFTGGRRPECTEAVDFNGDGAGNISDPIAALDFLFRGGRPPARGEGCRSYPSCARGAGCR
jgi:hypothetical protein